MPTIDNASTVWHWIEEVNGAIPATPEWIRFKGTAEGINRVINKIESQIITGVKAVTELIPTSGMAEGDVNTELHDDFVMMKMLENALQGEFDANGILKAGTLSKSFAFQRTMTDTDGAKTYRIYKGIKIGSVSIETDFTSDSAIGVTFSVMGLDVDTSGEIAGSTYVEADTTPVFNHPETRILSFTGDDITGDYCFTNMSLTVNSNAEALKGKCTSVATFPDLTAVEVVQRTRNTELNMSCYMKDNSFDTWFVNNSTAEIKMLMSNGTQGLLFSFPQLQLSQDQPPVADQNSTLVDEAVAKAVYNPSEGTDIIFERIGNIATDAGIKLTTATTATPDFLGTFYKDGTQNDGEDVYKSVDGLNAIWYSTSDLAYTVTAIADIGTFPTVAGWQIAFNSPVGSWSAIGTATGDVTGATYNPLA